MCAEGWLVTSHLRGGAGPGWASCIGGATLSQRQKSTTPLCSCRSVSHKIYFWKHTFLGLLRDRIYC
ncbi:hypothetical protein PUN28_005832 [Cardiocondyla obscurior]|uniref:Uncharacterized protein n=1 Tax=Cardiocondyla obscurior TaxID=286306 RepID=A0AAW2G7T6_9HYME